MPTKSTTKTAKTTKPKTASARVAAAPRAIEVAIPDSYTPISMWGYFAYTFVFAIPVIGWIICICLAFMANNHNLKNFARSQFCWLIIYVIVLCLLAGFGILEYAFQALTNH